MKMQEIEFFSASRFSFERRRQTQFACLFSWLKQIADSEIKCTFVHSCLICYALVHKHRIESCSTKEVIKLIVLIWPSSLSAFTSCLPCWKQRVSAFRHGNKIHMSCTSFLYECFNIIIYFSPFPPTWTR